MNAAPPGSGKTTAAAKFVAPKKRVLWLADRHEDVAAAAAMIEAEGGVVGKPIPLKGKTHGTDNCLHPETIAAWQTKGYAYVPGFCCHVGKGDKPLCVRRGNIDLCPFLEALDAMAKAPIVVTTKAYARRPTFFTQKPYSKRREIILDEDPIGLLRPAVEATREDLQLFLQACNWLRKIFQKKGEQNGWMEARRTQAIAQWCWDQISRQNPDAQPEPIALPRGLGIESNKDFNADLGRRQAEGVFRWMMRKDADGTVRNLHRDLDDMIGFAAAKTVYVTCKAVLFHLDITIPRGPRVTVLDATAQAELLRPIFAPRTVRVVCDEPVKPAGRIIQFMDFSGPRSYLNKLPSKAVRILDAIGDHHQVGTIVLISHNSCVKELAAKSKHQKRIRVAHFGAVRGRNDLEAGPGNPIACHVVMGSPKTTEEDRRRLALAVYGKAILPFSDLQDVRLAVLGRPPHEMAEAAEESAVWEIKLKGYSDPRMKAVYAHTVTAELTHAADRARMLIHPNAYVYLATNEPCPRLPFAERCYAADILDLTVNRADFDRNYTTFKTKAIDLLNAGKAIGNADVCRALDKTNAWGWRYWRRFRNEYDDALEGDRKVRWRGE